MKLFSDSSSSSSCSIYGVLRQLLCFNATTSFPESTIMNFQDSSEGKVGDNKQNNPGIVAKLMGLESLPNPEVETATSRRMKCAPSREGNDESFVENYPYSPGFVLEHDEEFIVISFEDESKGENKVFLGSTGKRRRKGKRFGGRKGRENLDPNKEGTAIHDERSCPEFLSENKIQELGEVFFRNGNSRFEIKNGVGSSAKTVMFEEKLNGRKQKKCLNSMKVEEQHSDFENSSPVSVLDTVPFDTDPGIDAKSGGNLTHGYINLEKKLPIELITYKESHPLEPVIDLQRKKIISNTEQKQHGSRDKLLRMLEGVCVLAQEDVINSNGASIHLSKLKEIEDISAEFELQIMGKLLDELVDQLIDHSI